MQYWKRYLSVKESLPSRWFFCVLLDDISPAFLFFFSTPLFIIFYFFSLDFGIQVVPKLFSKQFQKLNWKSQHTHLLENSLFLLNLLRSPCLELSEYLLFFFDIWQICVFPTIFDMHFCLFCQFYLSKLWRSSKHIRKCATVLYGSANSATSKVVVGLWKNFSFLCFTFFIVTHTSRLLNISVTR